MREKKKGGIENTSVEIGSTPNDASVAFLSVSSFPPKLKL